jgi:hypothetical protein
VSDAHTYHQPPPEATGPTRPSRHERARTHLDVLERLLLRIILIGLGVLLATALIAYFATRDSRAAAAAAAAVPPPSAPGAPASAVSIRLVFPDGVEHRYPAVPVSPGQTLLEAMTAARAGPRGLQFTTTGSKELTLVTSIAGLANEGSGAGRRNWLVSINGKPADAGVGSITLKPGDRVDWQYTAGMPGSPDTPPPAPAP